MTEPSLTPDDPRPTTRPDPVLEKRRRLDERVKLAKRVGYTLLLVFCVLGAMGFVIGFQPWLTTTAIVAVTLASVLLAPAIVLGYGVKAADREDRSGDWR